MTSRKEHIRNIEKAVEKLKRENKGKHFTSVPREEIERILTASSPRIAGWGITPVSTPGGTIDYQVIIYNPGPHQANWLHVHVWIGLRLVDPSGTFLLDDVDTRFPRLTGPDVGGLTVDPSSSGAIFFTLDIPATVEKTTYCLNTCLIRRSTSREWEFLDRVIELFDIK